MIITSIIRKEADKATDPLRAALAQAIGEQRKAEAAVVAQRAAISRAEALLEAAEERLTTAGIAVAEAREQDAQRAAEAIRAATPMAATGATKPARAAELEAQDQRDVAAAALAKLEGGLTDLEESARVKHNTVDVAINGVLTPVVEGCLAAAEDYKRRLAICMAVVGSVLDDATRRGAPLAGLRERHERIAALSAIDVAGDALPAALSAWRHALSALKQDASAVLPTSP